MIRAVSPSQPSLARSQTIGQRKIPSNVRKRHFPCHQISIPALNPASSPSQPRASFTISANFIPPVFRTIEIHRLISHKFKSLMGIHSRSFPSSRQTDPMFACMQKEIPNAFSTLRLFHVRPSRRTAPLKKKTCCGHVSYPSSAPLDVTDRARQCG